MAIPTYLPAPEQPGWPNLPDQGIPLVNAVAQATSLNLKRDEIQGKLAQLALRNQELEANDALKEKYYGLAQEKLGLQAEHNAEMADMMGQRLHDSEANQRELHDIMWGRLGVAQQNADTSLEREKITNKKLENKDAIEKRVNSYSQAMTDFRANHTPGTPDYALGIAAIDNQYSDVWQTAEGGRVYKATHGEHEQAIRDGQKAFDDGLGHLKTAISIATRGKDLSPYVFMMPENAWGKDGIKQDKDHPMSWVAHNTETGAIMTPKEVKDFKGDRSKIRFDTLYDDDINTIRSGVKSLVHGRKTLAELPGTYSGGSSSVGSRSPIPGMTWMRGPDGSEQPVPNSKVNAYKAKGAEVIY